MLEKCICPLCGSQKTGNKKYVFSPYTVVQCTACSLWYLNPRLNEKDMLAQYASDTYFSGSNGVDEGYSDYAEQEKSLRPTFSRFLKELDKHEITGGSLLEVGCGYGYLLDEAKSYFDYRVGTDFSKGAVQQAQERADKIILGGIDQLQPQDKFDCIIAVEVIEHIYHPLQFVSELYQHLKPGGWLVLAAPDMGSLWRKALQKRWPSFKLPEHITYYDQTSMHYLFHQCSYNNMKTIPFPHAFPVSVFLEKLNLGFLPAPKSNIWFPNVVIAMAAQRPNV